MGPQILMAGGRSAFEWFSWSSLGLFSPYYGAFESGGHSRIALERMQRADELGVCGEGLA